MAGWGGLRASWATNADEMESSLASIKGLGLASGSGVYYKIGVHVGLSFPAPDANMMQAYGFIDVYMT